MEKKEKGASLPNPKKAVFGKGASTRGVPQTEEAKVPAAFPTIRKKSGKPRCEGPVADRDPNLKAAYTLYLTNRNIQLVDRLTKMHMDSDNVPYADKDVARNRGSVVDWILTGYWNEHEKDLH